MVTFGEWISSTPTELNNAFFLLEFILPYYLCLRKGRKKAQQGRRNKKEI